MISKFYCTKCGCEGIPIFRKGNQRREAGHLKKIYCLNCQKEVNHVEVTEDLCGSYTVDDFIKEFEEKNFDEEGNRITPLNQFL